ncbi:SHOCT domain-containing protein [Alcaligenes sp. 1735tsa3]|uniref:SHOCT domain-containing protein n=1 Tax=Alcaligenes sp. 1735tsa3 TaxID=2953809 RepID=UPI0020A7BCD0|nr:SHOCT domain-containing protein [Alcaligenes sp. 1735tsa3]USY23946.1 SHOCT domain-containing protein [Alcaligenes sp. 1735tsa3]
MNVADEISKLADLKDRGALTDAEFEMAKAKVLSGSDTRVGVDQPSKTSWGKVVLFVFLGGVAIFFAIGFYASNTPEGKEQAKARAAIDLCWSDYKTSRLPLGPRKLIADTCDMMSKEFKEKYGVAP